MDYLIFFRKLNRIQGACFATSGPGATNVSTGVGAAFIRLFPERF